MSDRIFGCLAICVALAFIASATQIQTSFLMDPVGPKLFPMLIGGVAVICGLGMLIKPDADPVWPPALTFIKLASAVAVLVAYAYTLRPLGFLIPTAVAAGILSYQIKPKLLQAVLTGLGLSIGLFLLFKYALGLGLFAVPKTWLN
ncbi:MAG: tripartite tricarboxylate transporter TctB family protein [Granulosicoccus sp.]|nr:tripartite tricarboxylate transporter TctB family protein [Granulosicoccus sp.]